MAFNLQNDYWKRELTGIQLVSLSFLHHHLHWRNLRRTDLRSRPEPSARGSRKGVGTRHAPRHIRPLNLQRRHLRRVGHPPLPHPTHLRGPQTTPPLRNPSHAQLIRPLPFQRRCSSPRPPYPLDTPPTHRSNPPPLPPHPRPHPPPRLVPLPPPLRLLRVPHVFRAFSPARHRPRLPHRHPLGPHLLGPLRPHRRRNQHARRRSPRPYSRSSHP